MIFQLPNGKIVHLTIEEYLDLTEEDIQYLTSVNIGSNTPNNPFHGSVIKNPNSRPSKPFDKSIDFNSDDDEVKPSDSQINLDDLIDPDSL
jgi:hypothetical protein